MPTYSLFGIDVWIPDFNDLTNAITSPLSDAVNRVFSSISNVVKPLLDRLLSQVSGLTASVTVLVTSMLQNIQGQISQLIVQAILPVWNWLQDLWNRLNQALDALSSRILGGIQGTLSGFSSAIYGVRDAIWFSIKPNIDLIWQRTQGLAAEVSVYLRPWIDTIQQAIKGDVIPLMRLTGNTLEGLKARVDQTFPWLEGTLKSVDTNLYALRMELQAQVVQFEKILAAKLNEVMTPLFNLAVDIWKALQESIIKPLMDLFKLAWETIIYWLQQFGGFMIDTIHSIADGSPEVAVQRAALVSFTLGPLVTGVNIAAQAMELLHPIKQMGLVQTVTSILDSLGVTAFSSTMYALLVAGAIQAPIRQGLALRYRHTIPMTRLADRMMMEQNIDLETWRRIYGLYGWPDKYIEAWYETMWTRPGDRMIIGMVEGGEVDPDWLLDQLLKRGYRPEDAARLLRYATRKSLANEIAAITGEIQADLEAGQIDLLDARGELQDIGMRGNELEFRMTAMQRRMTRRDIKDRIDILTILAKSEEISVDMYHDELLALGLRTTRVSSLVAKEEARRKPKTAAPKETKRQLAIGYYQRFFIEDTISEAQLRSYLEALEPPLPPDRVDLLVLDAQIRKAKTMEVPPEIPAKKPPPVVIEVREVERYKGWIIYEHPEAYLMLPARSWTTLYVAYKPRNTILQGVDISDLKADIDEAER